MNSAHWVGPVLISGASTDAVIAAIQALNVSVVVWNRGAYQRVSAPKRCFVTREAIEKELGRSFKLPADLEEILCSFTGELRVTEDLAEWYLLEAVESHVKT